MPDFFFHLTNVSEQAPLRRGFFSFHQRGTGMNKFFADSATYIAHQAGRPITFVLAVLVVLFWAVSGPYFGYSDTWPPAPRSLPF